VRVSDGLVDTALGEAGLDGNLSSLLGGLLKGGLAKVAVRLPGAETVPITFEDIIEPATGSPQNVVKVGATVRGSEEGTTVLSAAGIPMAEANDLLTSVGSQKVEATLPVNYLSRFGIKEARLVAGRNGVELSERTGSGGEQSIELLLDGESRRAIYNLAPAVGEYLGWRPTAIYTDVVEAAESWVASSEIEINLYNANEPQEGLPEIHIGKPLKVEFSDDSHLYFEGFDLGKTLLLPRYITPYLPVAACFTAGELRATIHGDELPIVLLGEHAVETVGGVLADSLGESSPALGKIPWGKGDRLLRNITIGGIVLAPRGQIPSDLGLNYTVERPHRKFRELILGADIDRHGNLALGGWTANTLLDRFGLGVTDSISGVARMVPNGVKSAEITVDSDRVRASLNDEPLLTLRWDGKVRHNVARYLPIPDELPLGVNAIVPGWESFLLDTFAGAGRVRWGIRVGMKEQLPTRGLEDWLGRFGLLPRR